MSWSFENGVIGFTIQYVLAIYNSFTILLSFSYKITSKVAYWRPPSIFLNRGSDSDYSLRPMKNAILVFFRQISGGVKKLSYPHLFATCG
jgi:hypothetical protein